MSEPARRARRVIYCNGRILAAEEARLPVDDAGILYGMGFFETFRTSGGRPHHWRFHQARLEQACITAGIAAPPTFLARDEGWLREVVAVLLHENEMTEGVFRYTLTAGAASPTDSRNGPFLAPAEFMTLRPLPSPPSPEGISLRVLNLRRDNGEWLPRPKSLNYANAYAGAEELRRRSASPGDEGLFLSREGDFVVETARQNIAWIDQGHFRYPDSSLGAVAGTSLHWLLQSGLDAKPRRAHLTELLGAEAIFLLNSVRGITPVREVWDVHDRHRLRSLDSHAHPLVTELVRRWNESLRATAAA